MTDKTTKHDPIDDELFFRDIESKLKTLIKEYDPKRKFIMLVYSNEDIRMFANAEREVDDMEELKEMHNVLVSVANGLFQELQNPDSYNSLELN